LDVAQVGALTPTGCWIGG